MKIYQILCNTRLIKDTVRPAWNLQIPRGPAIESHRGQHLCLKFARETSRTEIFTTAAINLRPEAFPPRNAAANRGGSRWTITADRGGNCYIYDSTLKLHYLNLQLL